MKIRKVYEDFKYSPEMLKKIEDNWKDKTVYYVASPRKKRPNDGTEYDDIKNAIIDSNTLNMEWGEQSYCIFESKIRVLSAEEINQLLNLNKFNI